MKPLKERLAGPLALLRELTDAVAKNSASDTLIGYAFRSHVLSYRNILNEIEHYSESALPEAARTVDEGKAVILLRQVRDDWYRLTGYSQLKVDIDEVLERLDK